MWCCFRTSSSIALSGLPLWSFVTWLATATETKVRHSHFSVLGGSARILLYLPPGQIPRNQWRPESEDQPEEGEKDTEHWRINKMKKLASVLATALLIAALEARPAFGQSSGSFNAAGTSASCAIGTGGTFNGGVGGLNVLETGVQTSNGSGTTLVIRPSLVTGLFTDTKISTTVPSASADIGIQVCVTIDGKRNGIYPAGGCVVYDERFQQISSQLFSQLTQCTAFNTGQTCTSNADCASLGTGYTCSIPTGATLGTCVGPNPNCNFDLILSTLSAHNYDFVAQVPGGYHRIDATWSTIGQGASSGSSTASCVGPGVVTVTQTKVFQQNGTLSY